MAGASWNDYHAQVMVLRSARTSAAAKAEQGQKPPSQQRQQHPRPEGVPNQATKAAAPPSLERSSGQAPRAALVVITNTTAASSGDPSSDDCTTWPSGAAPHQRGNPPATSSSGDVPTNPSSTANIKQPGRPAGAAAFTDRPLSPLSQLLQSAMLAGIAVDNYSHGDHDHKQELHCRTAAGRNADSHGGGRGGAAAAVSPTGSGQRRSADAAAGLPTWLLSDADPAAAAATVAAAEASVRASGSYPAAKRRHVDKGGGGSVDGGRFAAQVGALLATLDAGLQHPGRARQDADQARQDADQARQDADQARQDADQAMEEASPWDVPAFGAPQGPPEAAGAPRAATRYASAGKRHAEDGALRHPLHRPSPNSVPAAAGRHVYSHNYNYDDDEYGGDYGDDDGGIVSHDGTGRSSQQSRAPARPTASAAAVTPAAAHRGREDSAADASPTPQWGASTANTDYSAATAAWPPATAAWPPAHQAATGRSQVEASVAGPVGGRRQQPLRARDQGTTAASTLHGSWTGGDPPHTAAWPPPPALQPSLSDSFNCGGRGGLDAHSTGGPGFAPSSGAWSTTRDQKAPPPQQLQHHHHQPRSSPPIPVDWIQDLTDLALSSLASDTGGPPHLGPEDRSRAAADLHEPHVRVSPQLLQQSHRQHQQLLLLQKLQAQQRGAGDAQGGRSRSNGRARPQKLPQQQRARRESGEAQARGAPYARNGQDGSAAASGPRQQRGPPPQHVGGAKGGEGGVSPVVAGQRRAGSVPPNHRQQGQHPHDLEHQHQHQHHRNQEHHHVRRRERQLQHVADRSVVANVHAAREPVRSPLVPGDDVINVHDCGGIDGASDCRDGLHGNPHSGLKLDSSLDHDDDLGSAERGFAGGGRDPAAAAVVRYSSFDAVASAIAGQLLQEADMLDMASPANSARLLSEWQNQRQQHHHHHHQPQQRQTQQRQRGGQQPPGVAAAEDTAALGAGGRAPGGGGGFPWMRLGPGAREEPSTSSSTSSATTSTSTSTTSGLSQQMRHALRLAAEAEEVAQAAVLAVAAANVNVNAGGAVGPPGVGAPPASMVGFGLGGGGGSRVGWVGAGGPAGVGARGGALFGAGGGGGSSTEATPRTQAVNEFLQRCQGPDEAAGGGSGAVDPQEFFLGRGPEARTLTFESPLADRQGNCFRVQPGSAHGRGLSGAKLDVAGSIAPPRITWAEAQPPPQPHVQRQQPAPQQQRQQHHHQQQQPPPQQQQQQLRLAAVPALLDLARWVFGAWRRQVMLRQLLEAWRHIRSQRLAVAILSAWRTQARAQQMLLSSAYAALVRRRLLRTLRRAWASWASWCHGRAATREALSLAAAAHCRSLAGRALRGWVTRWAQQGSLRVLARHRAAATARACLGAWRQVAAARATAAATAAAVSDNLQEATAWPPQRQQQRQQQQAYPRWVSSAGGAAVAGERDGLGQGPAAGSRAELLRASISEGSVKPAAAAGSGAGGTPSGQRAPQTAAAASGGRVTGTSTCRGRRSGEDGEPGSVAAARRQSYAQPMQLLHGGSQDAVQDSRLSPTTASSGGGGRGRRGLSLQDLVAKQDAGTPPPPPPYSQLVAAVQRREATESPYDVAGARGKWPEEEDSQQYWAGEGGQAGSEGRAPPPSPEQQEEEEEVWSLAYAQDVHRMLRQRHCLRCWLLVAVQGAQVAGRQQMLRAALHEELLHDAGLREAADALCRHRYLAPALHAWRSLISAGPAPVVSPADAGGSQVGGSPATPPSSNAAAQHGEVRTSWARPRVAWAASPEVDVAPGAAARRSGGFLTSAGGSGGLMDSRVSAAVGAVASGLAFSRAEWEAVRGSGAAAVDHRPSTDLTPQGERLRAPGLGPGAGFAGVPPGSVQDRPSADAVARHRGGSSCGGAGGAHGSAIVAGVAARALSNTPPSVHAALLARGRSLGGEADATPNGTGGGTGAGGGSGSGSGVHDSDGGADPLEAGREVLAELAPDELLQLLESDVVWYTEQYLTPTGRTPGSAQAPGQALGGAAGAAAGTPPPSGPGRAPTPPGRGATAQEQGLVGAGPAARTPLSWRGPAGRRTQAASPPSGGRFRTPGEVAVAEEEAMGGTLEEEGGWLRSVGGGAGGKTTEAGGWTPGGRDRDTSGGRRAAGRVEPGGGVDAARAAWAFATMAGALDGPVEVEVLRNSSTSGGSGGNGGRGGNTHGSSATSRSDSSSSSGGSSSSRSTASSSCDDGRSWRGSGGVPAGWPGPRHVGAAAAAAAAFRPASAGDAARGVPRSEPWRQSLSRRDGTPVPPELAEVEEEEQDDVEVEGARHGELWSTAADGSGQMNRRSQTTARGRRGAAACDMSDFPPGVAGPTNHLHDQPGRNDCDRDRDQTADGYPDIHAPDYHGDVAYGEEYGSGLLDVTPYSDDGEAGLQGDADQDEAPGDLSAGQPWHHNRRQQAQLPQPHQQPHLRAHHHLHHHHHQQHQRQRRPQQSLSQPQRRDAVPEAAAPGSVGSQPAAASCGPADPPPSGPIFSRGAAVKTSGGGGGGGKAGRSNGAGVRASALGAPVRQHDGRQAAAVAAAAVVDDCGGVAWPPMGEYTASPMASDDVLPYKCYVALPGDPGLLRLRGDGWQPAARRA